MSPIIKESMAYLTLIRIVRIRLQTNNACAHETPYAIEARVAGMMLIRRDVTLEDEQTNRQSIRVRATTRFGIGMLRSNAISKCQNKNDIIVKQLVLRKYKLYAFRRLKLRYKK
jgi:hypothetical protein